MQIIQKYGYFLFFVLIVFIVCGVMCNLFASPMTLTTIWTKKSMKPYYRTDRVSQDKGIVLTAGRFDLITNAIVLIKELQYYKCNLPIELWYNNTCNSDTCELPNDAKLYIESLGLKCYNFANYVSVKKKFQFKVAACYLSNFDHILFLDADNNVLCDPSYLFEMKEYKEHNAIFWPDYWLLEKYAPCYQYFPNGVKPKWNLFSQESGQMLINRKLYSDQLWAVFLCLEYGFEHLAPAPFNHGDKDWFHVTFNAMNADYYFIKYPVSSIGQIYSGKMKSICMGQRDNTGKLIFIHQNHLDWCKRPVKFSQLWNHVQSFTKFDPLFNNVTMGTWGLNGPNLNIESNLGNVEEIYFGFLTDLRSEEWYQRWVKLK
jgi:hypothetical protein